MDGIMSPFDYNLLVQMVAEQTISSLPSRPVDIEVIESPAVPVADGMTCHLTVGVLNEASKYTGGFGVVFEVDPSSTGAATILGGEGASGGGRYDVSGPIALGGRSRVVIRIDSPDTIYIDASIPECGAGGVGRYCGAIDLVPAATITGQ